MPAPAHGGHPSRCGPRNLVAHPKAMMQSASAVAATLFLHGHIVATSPNQRSASSMSSHSREAPSIHQHSRQASVTSPFFSSCISSPAPHSGHTFMSAAPFRRRLVCEPAVWGTRTAAGPRRQGCGARAQRACPLRWGRPCYGAARTQHGSLGFIVQKTCGGAERRSSFSSAQELP